MTLTTRRLQEIYVNLWGPHELFSISTKNNVVVLLDKFTCKLWILMLTNRNEFFDTFKLWLLKVEAYKSKLDCL